VSTPSMNSNTLMNRGLKLIQGQATPQPKSFPKLNDFDSKSDGLALSASIRDITARKNLERVLAESERKYRDMIADAVQGIFQSKSDGTLLYANRALLRMSGYDSIEELAETNLADVYVDPAQRSSLLKMLAEDGSCAGVELTLKKKDGTVISVREHSRVVKDADGTPAFIEGMIEDTTDQKRAEAELERERNQLRTLIDNLPDLVYFKDCDGKYVLNNQAHLRSIGASSQEEVVGKSSRDFHPAELAELYRKDEIALVETARPLLNREELALHKDTGERRWHLTSKFPIIDGTKKVTGFIGISRDITEQKELETRLRENMIALQASHEQLSQLNTQKDRMISILSHDLRSPFTSILGFCDILISEGESLTGEERTEFLTHIQSAAEQQLTLLNKLLDWSRLETGRIRLDMKDADLASVAAICIKSHLGTALKKGITLRASLPPGMMVHADEVMLSQVFNNLLSNALKFTPEGGTVSIEQLEATNEMWMIGVRDSGAGIPKDDLRKLFKVEEKYTRPGLHGEQGTGLGLSVVAEILKKHTGSISVESEEGKGTTFIIRLPKLVREDSQTLLVVDDDPGIRVLHSRFLRRRFAQAEVVQAADGHEALTLAKKYHPQAIITDYSMPEMNGFDLLNKLREDPTTKDIPVLVVSGKDSQDGTESLLLSGAAAVLTKPVSSKDLQEAVEGVLAGKR